MTALQVVQKFFPNVTHVRDAGRALLIEVTTKDISSSTTKNHKGCALAVACQRKAGIDGTIIAVKTAYLITGDKAVRYNLPESVSREIISFDKGGRFAAGEYRLIKPTRAIGDPTLPFGPSPRKNKGSRGKLEYRHMTEDVRAIGDVQ